MERLRALVVGGEPNAHDSIRGTFSQHAVDTRWVRDSAEAHEALRSGRYELLLVGLDAPGGKPIELLRLAVGLSPSPLVVGIVSGTARQATVEFVRAGGFDVIAAPPDPTELALLAQRARRQLEQRAELERLRQSLHRREGYERLVGRSEAMQRVRDRIEALAAGRQWIWISGEPGTGKELTARSIHGASARAELPFVVVDCAELAVRTAPHWLLSPDASNPFAASGGGTLYLEHVDALPLDRQARLQRTLEGLAAGDAAGSVRCIAASSGQAERQIDRGTLHEPLYRALSSAALTLPPLRDRGEDIPLLASHFLAGIVQINRLDPIRIAAGALASLQAYRWPGNVRELRGAIEHAVILATGGELRAADLPETVRDSEADAGGPTIGASVAVRPFREAKREVVDTFERAYLRTLLEHHGGNVTAAAGESGMLRSALQRLLRKHGLKSVSFRGARPAGRRPDREKIGLD